MRTLFILLSLSCSMAFGASRYAVTTGCTGNWGSTTCWSTTSGGSSGSAVPLSADDVHLDANSTNMTVDTTNRNLLSLNCTGYTGTLTMTQTLTAYSGDITLSPTMTIAGSAALIVLTTAANGTMTSNGKTWPAALTVQSATHTLADNWTVSGLLSVGSTSNTPVLNGSTLTVLGGLRFAGTTGTVSGTTVLKLGGTQTVDAPSATSGRIASPVTIDAGAGTVTFTSPVLLDVGKLNYVSGAVVTNATWASGGGGATQKAFGLVQ